MSDIPFLSTSQMIEVDRAMIEDYKILLIQMMENAGRNLAHLARTRFLDSDPRGKRVAVLAGKGGNGGGGMVSARRLHNWGAAVSVYTTGNVEEFAGVPAHQLDILKRMGVEIHTQKNPPDNTTFDLVIDAIIGYSLSGNPRGRAYELITWANEQHAPILSLDTPSGIDTSSGHIHTPAIKAEATLTLALPKEGLREDRVRNMIGELYLGDICVPPALYSNPQLKLHVDPIFFNEDIVRIW